MKRLLKFTRYYLRLFWSILTGKTFHVLVGKDPDELVERHLKKDLAPPKRKTESKRKLLSKMGEERFNKDSKIITFKGRPEVHKYSKHHTGIRKQKREAARLKRVKASR